MWLESLLEKIFNFLPRIMIMRPDEGGFRQTPNLWRTWPWNHWPWNRWPWIRWNWVRRPWIPMTWPKRDCGTNTWLKDLKPGNWYWLWPVLMEHEVCKIKPQVKDIRTQSVWTMDGVDIIIGASIRYYVKDWMKAQLEVLDYDESLQTTALVAIEEYIEGHTLSELKESRNTLRKNLLDAVKAESKGWGLQIQSVGITDIGKAKNFRLITNPANPIGNIEDMLNV